MKTKRDLRTKTIKKLKKAYISLEKELKHYEKESEEREMLIDILCNIEDILYPIKPYTLGA